MGEAVRAAIITGGMSILGIVITAILQAISTQNKIAEGFAKQAADIQRQSEVDDLRLQAKLENFQSVTNEKIDALARRVEKHNGVIERTYTLEKAIELHTEQIRTTNLRIDDIIKNAE